MSDQQVVLITGASSGVGHATARLLSQRGYRVFGTSRKPAGTHDVPDVEMVSLDVCMPDSVRACVAAVVERRGRIDVLINNAGFELAGAFEELSMTVEHPPRRETAHRIGVRLAPATPKASFDLGPLSTFSMCSRRQ